MGGASFLFAPETYLATCSVCKGIVFIRRREMVLKQELFDVLKMPRTSSSSTYFWRRCTSLRGLACFIGSQLFPVKEIVPHLRFVLLMKNGDYDFRYRSLQNNFLVNTQIKDYKNVTVSTDIF